MTRPEQKSHLFWILGLLMGGICQLGWADLEVASRFQFSEEPLSTDLVGTIDPALRNPHLQKWIVSRNVEILNLKSYKKPKTDSAFGVNATGLSTSLLGYVRPEGPWFQDLTQWSCAKVPDTWFSTDQGARFVASQAAEIWTGILNQEKQLLAAQLSKVSSQSGTLALIEGNRLFKRWLKRCDSIYRQKTGIPLRKKEWDYYLQKAKELNLCKGKTQTEPPPIRSLYEPMSGNPPKVTDLLGRLPVRRWGGLFSVRASVLILNHLLSGRFLMDSSAPQSVISPSWLEAQGVQPELLQRKGEPPRRIFWSQPGALNEAGEEVGLVPVGFISGIEAGGVNFSIQEVLIGETEFFSPPEYPADCCDGVLGLDFLRQYPMEFYTEIPQEVRVYPKKGFHWKEDDPWVDLQELENYQLSSNCYVVNDRNSKKHLAGVGWNLGVNPALNIHSFWRGSQSGMAPLWDVQCGSIKLADAIHASHSSGNKSRFETRFPAATLGLDLLSRGTFTVDLPHGKLWLSKNSLTRPPLKKNTSGLTLKYVMRKKERILVVERIQKNSKTAGLLKEGMRAGVEILQLGKYDPVDIDIWIANRVLAGDEGKVIQLSWMDRKDSKMIEFNVGD